MVSLVIFVYTPDQQEIYHHPTLFILLLQSVFVFVSCFVIVSEVYFPFNMFFMFFFFFYASLYFLLCTFFHFIFSYITIRPNPAHAHGLRTYCSDCLYCTNVNCDPCISYCVGGYNNEPFHHTKKIVQ